MPAATPVPRGPSVLTLYTAADLLTGPGCPACRYAGEAADRYLAWFALEGHVCVACLAAVRSEDDWLAHVLRVLRASDRGGPDCQLLLCGSHLGDAVVLAGRRGAPSLLAWQAGCLAAGLVRRRVPAGWLRTRRRRAGPAADGCPVCQASADAAHRAVDGFRASLRAATPVPSGQAAGNDRLAASRHVSGRPGVLRRPAAVVRLERSPRR